jgi:hypothetical protein
MHSELFTDVHLLWNDGPIASNGSSSGVNMLRSSARAFRLLALCFRLTLLQKARAQNETVVRLRHGEWAAANLAPKDSDECPIALRFRPRRKRLCL